LYAPLGFLPRVCSSHARRRHADAVVIVALLKAADAAKAAVVEA
jgi:hypothetical protein